jgi:hypothetical protein
MALHTADDRTTTALLAAGVLVVAGALTMAGCMQQRAPAPPGQAAQTQPGMGFFLTSNDDEGWKLAYGEDGTDNVWLMLECKPGSHKVEVFDLRHRDARKGDVLALRSGQVQSVLPTSLEPDDENGVTVLAHGTPELPALDGFRHTGSIAVKVRGREYALSASSAEKPQIAKFFSRCERAPASPAKRGR